MTVWRQTQDPWESAMDLRRMLQVGLEPFCNSLKTRLPRRYLGWLVCHQVKNTQYGNTSSLCLDCSTFCRFFRAYQSPLHEGFETQEGIFFLIDKRCLSIKSPLVFLFIYSFIYRLSIFSASYLKRTDKGASWTFPTRPDAAVVFALNRTMHLRTASDLWLCCKCPGSPFTWGAVFMCVWSQSEKPLPSHALRQKIKWAMKNSQFLRKTLHKTA